MTGERRDMPTQATIVHPPRVIETVFIGAAMKQASETIMDHDVPVRARHMRSIDDLLMFIEDNEVECAVVDQSLPTESRGLKLVLLAGVKQVKHLIVVAPPGSRAEIEAIDGVHQVLCSPATTQQVVAAVCERASLATPADLPYAAMVDTAAPVAVSGIVSSAIAEKISAYRNAVLDRAMVLRRQPVRQCWTQLTGRFVTRPVVAATASAFLCLGTISAVSLASGNFAVPGETQLQQIAVVPAQETSVATRPLTDQTMPSLDQSMPALVAAELSRRDARFRLLASRHTIDLEISKQQKLKRQFLAHIAHLKSITAELKAAETHSPDTGDTRSHLSTHTRAAVLRAELALQELEVDKIDTFLTHLNLLKSGVNLPDAAALKLAEASSAEASD
ncbi:MAG: hypothetical protein AAGA00_03570 [Pseudomonadota bacterium]